MTSIAPSPAELEALVARLVDQRVEERLGTQLQEVRDALTALQGRVATVAENTPEDRATLLVFSGEMDNLLAASIVASGAAAMGMQVSMFFTFWGLNALRRSKHYSGKSLGQKMVAMMLPKGPASVPTSRMNMGGIGPQFFKFLMAQRNVDDLPTMLATVRELGVRLIACEMSMGIMGIHRDELLEDIDYGGVATYLGDAARSKITLFI